MSSNYGYKPSDASTFNQLVQQGLSAEDAATQTGVSNNPGAYGYGTNSNLGSIIPGAGGVVGGAADAPELTRVVYPQSGTGRPDQQPAQTNTPGAESGFGYGTGINNPSVAPTTAAVAKHADSAACTAGRHARPQQHQRAAHQVADGLGEGVGAVQDRLPPPAVRAT
jgi:hypothetical protein